MKESIFKVTLTLMLCAAFAACTPGLPEVPGDGTGAATETQQPDVSAHLCANPLFPIVEGATWTYSSTGAAGATQPYSFTDTITEVREDGFTLTTQFTDLTRTQEWSCRPEGLVALQLGSGPAAGLSTSQMNLELTTSNINGVTLPSTVTDGQTWNYSLDFTGNMDIAGTPAEATGNMNSTFNAAGMENVTVPAGNFSGMKILISPTMNIQATHQGITVPVVFTGTSTVWFVPNVGWVKMVNTGDIQGTQFTETISLESYNIP